MNGIPIIDDSLGFMICEVMDLIDNDTHTLFIGKLVETDVYQEKEAMSINITKHIRLNYFR